MQTSLGHLEEGYENRYTLETKYFQCFCSAHRRTMLNFKIRQATQLCLKTDTAGIVFEAWGRGHRGFQVTLSTSVCV